MFLIFLTRQELKEREVESIEIIEDLRKQTGALQLVKLDYFPNF